MGVKHRYSFRGRIKVIGCPANYHCISRVVGGAHLLRDREKEVFRKMLRKQADFCGVDVLTFAIMSNHFHLLVKVSPQDLSDKELVNRVLAFYGPDEARFVASRLKNHEDGEDLRKCLLARIGDVSVFLKELKQRFSIWYNHTHERFGTLWAERFKSILVEGKREVLVAVAAYIDLNPVRAGLCEDPKDYRFCGYAEAVAGWAEARTDLCRLYAASPNDWRRVQSAYRLTLFGKGYHTAIGKGRIKEGALRQVLKDKGELSQADFLRCRVRYFSDGMALVSREFVERLFRECRDRYWTKRTSPGRKVSESQGSGLYSLNRMRGSPVE